MAIPHRFLIDENVHSLIGVELATRGHEVRLVADEIPGAEDRLVADYADEIEAAVITHNWRDFEPYIYRSPHRIKKRPRYDPSVSRRRAGAVYLELDQYPALHRMRQSLTLIEFECARALTHSDMRVIVRVRMHDVLIER